MIARRRWGAFIEPELLLGKAYHLEGKANQLQRKVELAAETFEDLYARSKSKDETALWIAVLYHSVGETDRGVTWAEKICDPSVRERVKVDLYTHADRFGAAVESQRHLAELPDADLTAQLELGRLLLKAIWMETSGKPLRVRDAVDSTELQELSTKLVKSLPQDGDVLSLVADAMRLLGELDRAREYSRRALASRAGAPTGAFQDTEPRRPVMNIAGTIRLTKWVPPALVALAGHVAAVEGSFGEPQPLGPEINSPWGEWRPTLSADERQLYFSSQRPGGVATGDWDIYVAVRDGEGEFTDPRILAELDSRFNEFGATLSEDGKEIIFVSLRPGVGGLDLWYAKREAPDEMFGPPENLRALNSDVAEAGPFISGDGLTLYFSSERSPHGIHKATRAALGEPSFEDVTPVLATEFNELGGSLSADGKYLFWGDWEPLPRSGGHGWMDLWMAPFGPPPGGTLLEAAAVNLGSPPNTALCETAPWISRAWPASGSELYFTAWNCEGEGFMDIYRSTWAPAVPHFKRGDADSNGVLEVTDTVVTLRHLFLGDPKALDCRDASDTNDDGALDLSDPVGTLTHLFGNFAIAAPGPTMCGPDATTDKNDTDLGCNDYPAEACRS